MLDHYNTLISPPPPAEQSGCATTHTASLELRQRIADVRNQTGYLTDAELQTKLYMQTLKARRINMGWPV
jgi:hypothetical protein